MLIRTWKPWTASTGQKTAEGKQVASKNAVAYSCRELLREMARTNRALVGFINGSMLAPTFDRTTIDRLLDDLEAAVLATSAKPSAASVKRQAKPPSGSGASCNGRVSETTP